MSTIISALLWIIGAITSAFLIVLTLSWLFRKLAELFEALVLRLADPFGSKERRKAEQKRSEDEPHQRDAGKQQQQQQKSQIPPTQKQQQQAAAEVRQQIKQQSWLERWEEVVSKWEDDLDRDTYAVEELLDRQQDRFMRMQVKYAPVRNS